MSKLDQLSWRGVRSFPPKTDSPHQFAPSIKFGSPLTIIIGHNGAGKTTIIETLKYITTGVLPPNSTDGAFIYDPRLNNAGTNLASIKLSFTAANQEGVIAGRQMQATLKGKKVSFETVDSSVVITHLNGHQEKHTYRAKDFEEVMPTMLGVSKAILENVIFVHQEDSSWPLRESSELKKKFDDIFASTRYTKAVDTLKNLIKKYEDEHKQDVIRLEHATENREKAARLRVEAVKLDRELAKVDEECARLQLREIQPAMEKLSELGSALKKTQELLSSVRQHQATEEYISQDLKRLEGTMTRLNMGLIELKQELNKIVLANGEEERNVIKRKITLVEDELKRLEQEYGKGTRELGRLQGERQSYKKLLDNEVEFIGEFCREHQIVGFSGIMDRGQVGKFIIQVETMSRELNSTVEGIRNKYRKELGDLNGQLASLKNGTKEYEDRKNFLQGRQGEITTKLTELRRNLAGILVGEEDLSNAKASVEMTQGDLDLAKQELDIMTSDKTLIEKERELENVRVELRSVRDELTKVAQEAANQGKVESLRGDAERKRLEIAGLLEKIEKLLPGVNVENLQGMIQDFLQERQEKVNARQEHYNLLQNQETIRQEKLSSLQRQISEKKQQLEKVGNDLIKKLQSISMKYEQGQYLEEGWEEKRNRLEDLKQLQYNNASQMEGFYKVYAGFLKELDKNDKCALCHRGFNSRQEIEAFRGIVEGKLEKARNKVEGLMMGDIVNALNDVLALEEEWILSKRLEGEIPELENQREPLMNDSQCRIEELELGKKELEKVEGDFREATMLKNWSETIYRVDKEIKGLEMQIRQLEVKLGTKGRGAMEIQSLVSKLEMEEGELIRFVEKLKKDLSEKREEVGRLGNLLMECKQSLTSVETKVKQRMEWQKEVEKLEKEHEGLESQIFELTRQFSNVEPSKIRLEGQVERLTGQEKLELEDVNGRLNVVKGGLMKIKGMEESIGRYETMGLDGKVKDLETTLTTLAELIMGEKKKLEGFQTELNGIDNRAAEMELKKRNLEDNIGYLEAKIRLEEVKKNLESAKQEYEAHKSQDLQLEQEKWSGIYQKASERLANLNGKSVAQKERRAAITQELDTQYLEVDSQFQNLTVTTKTQELALHDMKAYRAVLSEAIVRFHKAKMEEINRIIQELWSKTYHWSDIDGIEIVSELAEKDPSKSSYRVVMIRGDKRLDMRGRCSAGQRVLACIIIRLALAQAFGISCGVFALDEPTTNLDAENVDALAQSLVSIIEDRSKQENFQLILITHDEEFITKLNSEKFVDRYFVVQKADEGGSHVYTNDIGNLGRNRK